MTSLRIVECADKQMDCSYRPSPRDPLVKEKYPLSYLMQWKRSRKKAELINNQSPAWTARWITTFNNLKDILRLPCMLYLTYAFTYSSSVVVAEASLFLTNLKWTACESITVLLHIPKLLRLSRNWFVPNFYQQFSHCDQDECRMYRVGESSLMAACLTGPSYGPCDYM